MRIYFIIITLFLAHSSKADEFNEYGLYSNKSASPQETAPVKTTLPLIIFMNQKLRTLVTLFLIGLSTLDILNLLQRRLPDHKLVIRNFSWSADEVDIQPRPDNFATTDQHLLYHKTDIIFAAFGFNESFSGKEKIPEFKSRLSKFINHTKTRAYNGTKGPKIILISPTPNQNLKYIPAADLNNERLLLFTQAMREVANSEEIGFVDVFSAPSRKIHY